MSEFSYKVTLQADCGAKRFVAFHDDDYYNYSTIDAQIPYHLSSQTCPRCNENHEADDFCVVNLERRIH